MKNLGSLIAVVGLLTISTSIAREFADSFGRTIEAEIQSVRAPNVVLVRADGKTFVLPVAKLSEADREFVKKWAKENPDINLDYRFDKDKLSAEKSKDRAGNTTTTRKDEKWVYKVTIQNRSLSDIEDLTFEYTIFKQRNNPDAKDRKSISGTVVGKKVATKIERQRAFTFNTEPIATEDVTIVTKVRNDADDGYDSDYETWTEALIGIKIVAKHNDKIVDTKEYGVVE